MGLHPATSLLAWLLENLAVMGVGSAALAVVLRTSGIFAHSNAFIVFLFLLDFGVSVIMLSYFLSAFFSRANTAALCTSLVYMISFLPYVVLLVLHSQLSAAVQTLLVSGGSADTPRATKLPFTPQTKSRPPHASAASPRRGRSLLPHPAHEATSLCCFGAVGLAGGRQPKERALLQGEPLPGTLGVAQEVSPPSSLFTNGKRRVSVANLTVKRKHFSRGILSSTTLRGTISPLVVSDWFAGPSWKV